MSTRNNQSGVFSPSRLLAHTWRCSRCSAKLGAWSGGALVIKQREAMYRLRHPGIEVEAICRTCGLVNKGTAPF